MDERCTARARALLIVGACGGGTGSSDGGTGNGDGEVSFDGPRGLDANPCGTPAELTGPMAEMDLSVPGRVYELDLASGDFGAGATPGNGCVVTAETTGGFGGAPGVRVVPPDVRLGGPKGNSEYCGLAAGAPVSRGGVEVAQLNVRYALYVGAGYAAAITSGHGPKAIIPVVTDAAGTEGLMSRPMVFWGLPATEDDTTHAAIAVTEGTLQSYQEPEDGGYPAGPGRDALYFGPAPDHAGAATAGTPVIGDEWIVLEHEIDLRRDHGNPDGLNRLWVWTRDGVLAGPALDIPLNWDENHDFSGDRVVQLDGLGWYWNQPAVRTADDHVIYSHLAFAANRTGGQPIGPPPGFLDDCAE